MARFSAIMIAGGTLAFWTIGGAGSAEPPGVTSPAKQASAGQEAPPSSDAARATGEQETSFWMEKKLDYTQAILRALASGDFPTIKENSELMRRLSKVEGFVRSRNREYRTQLNTFERICSQMTRQADQQNLEGVVLAFNQLTVSCVSCHQQLRQTGEPVSGGE